MNSAGSPALTFHLNRLKALVEGDYITYFPSLTPVCGSYKAAAMLSVALAWTRNWLHRHPEREGWFWKTRDEWILETGLSRREQESARKTLVMRGLFREARRGMPARMHYRLDLDCLGARLMSGTPSRPATWDWDDPQLRRLLGRPVALYRRLTWVAGSLSGGLLLSQLLIACRRDLALNRMADGWIRHFPQLVGRHCQLTRHEVDGARTRLAERGLLEARFTKTLPTHRVVRLSFERLIAALEGHESACMSHCANQALDKPAIQTGACRHPGEGQSARQAWNDAPDRDAANRPTSRHLSGNSPSGAKPRPERAGGPSSRAGELRQEINPYPPPAPSTVIPVGSSVIGHENRSSGEGEPKQTAEPPLVFSGTLLPAEQAIAHQWLADMPPALRQLVLDEHAGMVRGREVRNPLGYLHTLIQAARADRFVPTIAFRVAQAREEAQARADAQRQARAVLRQNPDPAARLVAREHLARMRAQLGMGSQGGAR
ncbi:MAG: hypothetical protein AB1899_10895 [Pseudomonadota bacterium]